MGDLTNNLSRHEFACKCGCGFDTVDKELTDVIQEVCSKYKCSVTIGSGCRCSDHNLAEGGGSRSQHLRGRAGDCRFTGISPTVVYAFLEGKYPGKYGLGLYNTFIHIDTRTKGPARWDYRS